MKIVLTLWKGLQDPGGFQITLKTTAINYSIPSYRAVG